METILQNKTTFLSLEMLTNSLYVGIDPHKYEHYVIIANRHMDVLRELKVKNSVFDINLLIKEINKIKNKGCFNNVIIGIEGYHGNGDFLTRNLLTQFNSVYEVPVCMTSRYRKSNVYREKTDRIDAMGIVNILTQRLSELSVVNSESSNETAMMIRDLNMSRERLIVFRIGQKNAVHHLMQHIDPEYVKVVKHFDSKKAQKQTKEFCLKVMNKKEMSNELKLRAKLVISHLDMITNVVEQINMFEKEMENILSKSKYMKIIESYKGISFVAMSQLLSSIYTIDRFATPEKFCKYCGITPVSFSSGSSTKFHNTCFGVKSLRTLLRTVSIVRVRRVPEDKEFYQKQITRGKNPKQSLKLVMRRNALTIYALLRKDQAYVTPVLRAN